MRPPDEVDGRGRARLVHRHRRRPVARDPLPVAERLGQGVAERGEDVLHRVMLVHVEVTAREQLEIDAGVERPEREQVVEEPDARRAAVRPEPSRSSDTRSAVSVLVRDDVRGAALCGSAAAPSAARRTSFSRGLRSVIRMPPLTTRTTSPCSSSVAPSGSSERRKTKLPWPSGQS